MIRISMALLAIRVASIGAVFCLNVYIARSYGSDRFGGYALAIAWVNVLALLAMRGLDTVSLRAIVRVRTAESSRATAGYMHWATKRVLVSGLVMSLTLILIARYAYSESWLYGVLVGTLVIGWSLALLWSSFLVGLERPVAAQCPYYLLRPSVVFFAVAVLSISPAYTQSLNKLIGAEVVAILVSLSVLLWTLVRTVTPADKKVGQVSDGGESSFDEWRSAGNSVLILGLGQMVFGQFGTIYLGFFYSQSDVGIFASAVRISAALGLVLAAVNTFVAPRFAKYYALNEYDCLQQLAARTSAFAFAAVALASIPLWLYPDFFMGLFGHQFRAGWPLLCILIFGQIANAFCGSVQYLLIMTGHHNSAKSIMVVVLIGYLALTVLFIPMFGAVGAAVSMVIALFAWNFGFLIRIRALLAIDPTPFGLKRTSLQP